MKRSLEWSTDHLRLIDQRRLPQELTYLELRSWPEVVEAIREMTVRGAPAIGAAAAFGLALAGRAACDLGRSEWLERFEEAAQGLATARPTAVNLSWAIDRVRRRIGGCDAPSGKELAKVALDEAQAIANEDARVNAALGEHGAALVPEGARILTHCNTGALATVEWGTALAVIYKAHAAGKALYVWVGETRPRQQGARLTAWELQRAGVPMTLISDTAAGRLFQTGRVDLVVVGADRVAANGDVVNKIGTYPLAVLAHRHGVPFYAALPLSTIDLGTATGADAPIEERAEDEVLRIDGRRIAPEGVRAANPAFDVTPHQLVTGIITEVGVLRAPYRESLRAALDQSPTT